MAQITWYMAQITCYMVQITCYMVQITCYNIWCRSRDMAQITCYMAQITCYMCRSRDMADHARSNKHCLLSPQMCRTWVGCQIVPVSRTLLAHPGHLQTEQQSWVDKFSTSSTQQGLLDNCSAKRCYVPRAYVYSVSSLRRLAWGTSSYRRELWTDKSAIV